ncbi:MAG: PAS domain S-box protein [Nitrospiraceae bacterium]|nr:PAS domain S-box protein [Nitrospiraceae bacterium]
MLHRDITPQKYLERTLQTAEEQTRSILDAMTELVMILDARGRIMQIPTRNSALLPRAASEMVGHLLDEVLPHTADIQATLKAVLQTQRSIQMDLEITVQDEKRHYHCIFSPFRDEHILMVAHDTTAQWRADDAFQETAARYRQLFEYANDAIMLVDVETNHILDANRQACRSLGYSHDELLLLSLDDLDVTTPTGDTERPFLSMSGRMITEHAYKHRNGHPVTVESSTRVITVNGKPTLLTFSRDISERQRARAAEREQRLLAEALRDTASALNSTLELGEVMERILSNISRIVQMESASVMLIEDGVARIVGQRGYPPDLLHGLEARRYYLEEMPTLRWMFEHKQALLITIPRGIHCGRLMRICCPFNPIWALQSSPASKSSAFSTSIPHAGVTLNRNMWKAIKAFSDQAGVALKNAKLYEQSQRYAEELETKVAHRTEMLVTINGELTEQITERQSVEEALQEERNLLRTVIDNLPDHVYVKDIERRFILANIALARFLRTSSPDALRGQRKDEFYSPEQAVIFAEQERQIMTTMQPQTAEEVQVVTRGRHMLTAPSFAIHWFC